MGLVYRLAAMPNIAQNSMPNNSQSDIVPKAEFSIVTRASKAWIPLLHLPSPTLAVVAPHKLSRLLHSVVLLTAMDADEIEASFLAAIRTASALGWHASYPLLTPEKDQEIGINKRG
jgi:hypothetical protein